MKEPLFYTIDDMADEDQKLNFPEIEEKILEFWKKNRIFEKSLAAKKKAKRFRFYEGPPTANGRPGIHHVLARVFKDIICRYKTMRGFLVERKAGWDTHGLPVELEVEKELGIRQKADIEKFGIAAFNKKCRHSVWRYKDEWERLTERIGFWLDMERPYVTLDNNYIESLWWIIGRIWKKKLLFQDYKVVPYCPRCGTALSSHEVALGYRRVSDPSIYVKFPLKGVKNTYFLVWTTTPWTLPANVAVAVNPRVEYTKFKINGDFIYSYSTPPYPENQKIEISEKVSGKSLVGLTYEPLYPPADLKALPNAKNIHKVVPADFVSVEEGTGFVHIAPAFGEDDLNLGKAEKLPVIHNVDGEGRFIKIKDQNGIFSKISGKFVKDADPIILEDLKSRGLLYFSVPKGIEHEYPFCWRCDSPLLYYAKKSWFVGMEKLKDKLLDNNRKISWVPAHLKEGRFGEWLREVKDWAFSRERYWGTPLPVWICGQCRNAAVIGGLEELAKKSDRKNKFFILRHGEASANKSGVIASWPEKKNVSRLTETGKEQVRKAARALKKKKIDLIFASDLKRIRETAAILKKEGLRAEVVYAKELREINCGIFNGRPVSDHKKFFSGPLEEFIKRPEGGENLADVKKRIFGFVLKLNREHKNKNILIVGHGDPLWVLEGAAKNLSNDEISRLSYPELGGWKELSVRNWPYNENGELDLHRPFVDEVEIACPKCRAGMERVKEVTDVWFDSGAMPFAQWHFPFENKERVEKEISFPADYICEAVDQTRGWFYTLLAVSALLEKGPAFLNVVSLGHILDERGEKMSKSRGNAVDPWQAINKYSSDALRWYFYTINPPGEPKKFAETDVAERLRRFFLTLANVLAFFETYAVREEKSLDLESSAKDFTALDRWIISRLQELIAEVRVGLDQYDITKSARLIDGFVDDLSRWYLRRSRRRFQHPESGRDRAAAQDVLFYVISALAKIIAPFTPFFAEYVFQKIARRVAKREESVHLCGWPEENKKLISKELNEAMNFVRQVAALGLKARAKAGVKVRQPLPKLKIKNSKFKISLNKELLELIQDEINVKEIEQVEEIKEGRNWVLEKEGNLEIALNIEITARLKEEGILRELIRQVQEMRRDAGLRPGDKILFRYDSRTERPVRRSFGEGGSDLERIIGGNKGFVKKEINAGEIQAGDRPKQVFDIEREIGMEGEKLWLGIKKV